MCGTWLRLFGLRLCIGFLRTRFARGWCETGDLPILDGGDESGLNSAAFDAAKFDLRFGGFFKSVDIEVLRAVEWVKGSVVKFDFAEGR